MELCVAWLYFCLFATHLEVVLMNGLKVAVDDFVVNINNFFCVLFGKKCHNTQRQLFVSSVV